MRQNRDEAVRVALDLQKKDLTNSLKRDFDKDLARLEGEVLSLKQVSMLHLLVLLRPPSQQPPMEPIFSQRGRQWEGSTFGSPQDNL